jgi:hypothetical protein
MSGAYDLHIRPHGDGRFAVWDRRPGGELALAAFDTEAEAQSEIDTHRDAPLKLWALMPGTLLSTAPAPGATGIYEDNAKITVNGPGGLVINGVDATELVAKHPRRTGGQRGNPEDVDFRPSVRNLLANATAEIRNRSLPKIFEWLQRHGVTAGRTMVIKFLGELRDEGVVTSPRRRKRR